MVGGPASSKLWLNPGTSVRKAAIPVPGVNESAGVPSLKDNTCNDRPVTCLFNDMCGVVSSVFFPSPSCFCTPSGWKRDKSGLCGDVW